MKTFYETIFLKDDSSLEAKLNILKSNNIKNKNEYYMLEKGIAGEKQVAYHLKKSNIGMYAMRDINISCGELNAQIDFIVVTSHHCYFIECKNYNADIIRVDETRNFEMSTRYGKKYNKLGIKSPISQVEDQLNVFKKICLNNSEKTKELLSGIKFKDYFKTLVVFTNPENRLDTKKAPLDIKYKLLKVDNLIRQIEYEEKHYKGKKLSQDQMEHMANYILSNNVAVDIEKVKPIEIEEVIITNKKQNNNLSEEFKNSLIRLLITLAILMMIYTAFSSTSKPKSTNPLPTTTETQANKTLTDDQIKAINIIKSAYEDSKKDGFTIIHTSVCREISTIFNDGKVCESCCNKLPIEVNIISDNHITIYKRKTNSCSTLIIDENGKKIDSAINEQKECPGQPVGMIEWDTSNKYYYAIGGYDELKRLAIESYTHNGEITNNFTKANVEARDGETVLYNTYTLEVNMFFSGVTGKGSPQQITTTEKFNKMIEYYYYIKKYNKKLE